MSTIFLRIIFLDKNFDRADEFSNKRWFDDYDHPQGECAGYILAKTTEEEAAKILGSRWKQYIVTPAGFELSYFA